MRRMDRDQNRVFEWWKITALAKLQFLFDITGEVVVPRKLDRRRKRRVTLDENFSRRFAASGAPRHLRQQLKRPLTRAKIRKMQRQIRVDDSNEGNIWKMQPLRNHLRPDQDIDLAGTKLTQRFAIRFLARHRVGIHSSHNRIRKNLP